MTTEHDADPRQKFRHLPPLVHVEDTITSQETWPTKYPEIGHDTDRDFLIRYSCL